jgi:ParB family chromosome partitioning protein
MCELEQDNAAMNVSDASRAADNASGMAQALQQASQRILAHATMGTASHGQLVPSAANARKQPRDLSELKALVRAMGVLQNLVCFAQQHNGVPTGLLEIAAGKGRWQVVGELITEGDLPEDYQLPYLLVDEGEAVLVSLAENLGRGAMHPADIFDGMRALAAQGRDVADIALAFGVSAVTVRQRLKLANVAPRLFDLYRADRASYEQMAALAVSDDHAAQLAAWDSLSDWERQPNRLRRMLTQHCVALGQDRVARYVGLKAYQQAGGLVTRDLFSPEEQGYIDDVALLDRLAQARLERLAGRLHKEGWRWIAVHCRIDASALAAYGRVRTETLPPTPEQAGRLAQLAARAAALRDQLAQSEAAGEDEDGAALRELAAVELEQGQLRAALQQPDRADLALAGALVTVDDKGKACVLRGLIRPQDRPQMAAATRGGVTGKERVRGPHSARLTATLTAQRTLALRAELVRQPEVALRVLAHQLLRQVFYEERSNRAVQLEVRPPQLPSDAEDGAAWECWQAQRAALAAILPESGASGGLMEWLQRQPRSVIDDCIAFCTACGVDGVQQDERTPAAITDLVQAVGLDMRKWWQPTAQAYFAHVPKAHLMKVVAQVASPAAAVPLERMSKQAAADAAARALAECGWLPPVLGGPVAGEEVAGEEVPVATADVAEDVDE